MTIAVILLAGIAVLVVLLLVVHPADTIRAALARKDGGKVTGTIRMLDTAWDGQFAAGYEAYAAYVDGGVGDQPNYGYIVAEFPHARHLSITLDPARDADCLDIETGAAQPPAEAGWFARQEARGVARPCFYASASTMQARVVPVMLAAGIARQSVRLWSAHYGAGAHICGPDSCRLTSIPMDGTQWTDQALGRSLDESLLLADFFGTPKPVPPPSPVTWEEIVADVPTIRSGSTGQDVKNWQGLLNARGHAIGIDGNFGAQTEAATVAVQKGLKVTPDGSVGPATWKAALA